MASSNIDMNIKYKEHRKLQKEDSKYEASLYEMELFNNKFIIAIGKANNKYIDNNIIYYPIYLIKDNKVISQIGVYETSSDRLPTLLDSDGDLRLELLNDPILFSFVDEQFVETYRIINENEKTDDLGYSKLKEQTQEEAKKEQKGFKPSKTLSWIQHFMKNKYFNIIQTKPDGNCFFESISIALKSVGIEKSISELRELLAVNFTKEIFNNYKDSFDMFETEIKNLKKEKKDLTSKHTKKKTEFTETNDRTQKKLISEQVKVITNRYREIKDELTIAQSYLDDFAFMSGINTFEAFKNTVQTNNYWADDTAIVYLQKLLNIKFILLSKKSFLEKDFSNVLHCGRKEDDNDFNPDHYIMVSYNGNHYELITYRERSALKFVEIPYDIKELIYENCFNGEYTPYSVIPEFKNAYQEKKSLQASGIDLDIQNLPDFTDSVNDLYDNKTVFIIGTNLSNSRPGYNNNEVLNNNDSKEYIKLESIKNWRKLLSDSYIEPFELDDKKWASVEHYYNASKFIKNNKDFYDKFSLDSNSELSKNSELAISNGTNDGFYNDKLVRDKKINIDRDFYDGRNKTVLLKALDAKFRQNEQLKKTLLETKNAKLLKYFNKKSPIIYYELMEVRSNIRNDNKDN